jgi:hypothetical protein
MLQNDQPVEILYEIFVRKGEDGGPFTVSNQDAIKDYASMLSIAKDLVNKGEFDEVVLLQKRVLKRFRKYGGQG